MKQMRKILPRSVHVIGTDKPPDRPNATSEPRLLATNARDHRRRGRDGLAAGTVLAPRSVIDLFHASYFVPSPLIGKSRSPGTFMVSGPKRPPPRCRRATGDTA